MEEKNIKIRSQSDGLDLDITIFIPQTEIKGIVQISHGMAEHKERYFEFMKFLSGQGYLTIIHDHRGHGKSVKDKEDLGYFYDNTATYIVEDLYQITNYIKKLYPNKKVILFGHSMGSMVVRKYIKKYDKDIDKLIICGSPSKNPYAKMGLNLAKITEKIKNEKYRSRLIQNLAFGNYNKSFKEASSINSWICKNQRIVQEYDKDELCGFLFTVNGFQNLFNLMIDIYDKKHWFLNNKELPIFFIAGSNDPVIINNKKWLESQDFLREIGYKNIRNRLYSGLRHEVLNEENKEEIYQDILKFIER